VDEDTVFPVFGLHVGLALVQVEVQGKIPDIGAPGRPSFSFVASERGAK